jgi:hypothetical protein
MKTVNAASVSALLHKAVDELNLQLPKGKKLSKEDSTALVGATSVLDSLLLMNLIVAVEEKCLEELGLELSLADEAAGPPETTPLRTLGALGQYIVSRANDGAAS